MKKRILASAALLAATLTACVSQGPFPSLAVRPAEREHWSEEPVHTAPPVADDAAVRTRVAALLAAARAGSAQFDADIAAAERAAARSGAEGSDTWIEAQQALSRVEAARGDTTNAATELHQLRLERTGTATSAADLALIDDAIAQAEALSARQEARVARIEGFSRR